MTSQHIERELQQVGDPTGIRGINVLYGDKPGPNIGLMGMLHGNEHAGYGVWDLARRIGIPARGNIFLIIGHPEACFQPNGSTRSLIYDINRLFDDDLLNDDSGLSADHARCSTLKSFLPNLDILIDFHSTSARTEPFVIVPERRSPYLDLALNLPITQLFGLERFLACTATSWLARQGRTGIMVEVGQHQDPESRGTAADIACRVLNQLQMIKPEVQIEMERRSYTQRHIGILDQMRVEGSAFKFSRDCANFDSLEPGEIIAQDTARQYLAPHLPNLVVCMPTAIELLKNSVGSSAFYLGADLGFMKNVLSQTMTTQC